MKIAFVTISDAQDVNRGSGTPYFLTRQLIRMGHQVHYICPLEVEIPLTTRIMNFIARKTKKKYRIYQDPFFANRLGKAATQKLASVDYDLVLTNDFAIAGTIKTDKSIVLYTDAWFPIDYSSNIHSWLSNLSPISVLFCQRAIKKGLQKSAKCLFASAYALDQAKAYGIPEAKLEVIEYGANIDIDPPSEVASKRNFNKCIKTKQINILFVGKDWDHKGGKIVLAVQKALQKQGVKCYLDIVGTIPHEDYDKQFVRVHNFLDKCLKDDSTKLGELYSSSDILLVPSRAEGFGLVYAEAAAYGLPSLGYNTTGVKNAVKNGISGVLLESDKGAEDFAAIILEWFKNPDDYGQLTINARKYYETTVNWYIAATHLLDEISKLSE